MHGSARRFVLALPVVFLVAGAGCTRAFFRDRADADVAGVITQKNLFPAWAVKNWYAYPHPCARFADPYNPDRPPYPPDDYAALVLSPNPQHPTKKAGVGRSEGDGYLRIMQEWDAENRAEDAAARGSPPDRILAAPQPYMNRANAGIRTANPVVPVAVGQGATQPGSAEATTAAAATPADADQWMAAKPQNLVGPELPFPGPSSTNARLTPVVTVGVEKPDAMKIVPAVAVAPANQPPAMLPDPLPKPPEKLPTIPIPVADPKLVGPPLPEPKPGDPKAGDATKGKTITVGPLTEPETPDNEYLRVLATNVRGLRIKLDQAVELGLFNSREFQDRREDLYLAALPVTLERFNLATQAFFTEQVVRNFTGSNLSGAGRLWSLDTTGGITKTFATGGTLLVQFANQVVINLGQGRPDIAMSNLTLDIAQPFLRGGGLAVTLENLTAAERNLVYGMRSYARFRKLFYVATAAGPTSALGLTNNPYGLQGLAVNLGRGIGQNLTAPIVGYLPLLQQIALVSNNQRNVAFLERLLRLYQAFREGGQQSDLQVMQVEVQLLTSRAALLGPSNGGTGTAPTGSIRGYLDALDNYKLQLGVPLTLGIDLDDAPLKPIRLQLTRFEAIYADVQKLENAARLYNPSDPINEFRPRWIRLLTESDLVKGTALANGIGAKWDSWSKLPEDQFAARVAKTRKERSGILDRRADRLTKGEPEPEAETRRLAELEFDLEIAGFEQAVRGYLAQRWAKLEGPARAVAQAAAFRDVFNAFYELVLEARNERLEGTSNNWPRLPSLPAGGVNMLTVPLDEAHTAGIQAALTSRLDLMNARAQVVDAWRQIAVEANALQGVLNVEYNLNAGTPVNGSQPFSFFGSHSRQQLTFNAELPLVRRAERNNYRATLINYQRQRRFLMAFEDNIANDVRNDIRELRTLGELYKIQHRVVALQYAQVDNAQAILLQPPIPGTTTDAGSAAALTNQLLQAQSNLLSAQNQLYSIWVSYLSARMALYLDLELMQLDDRGVWIDEQVTGSDDSPRSEPEPERKPERERLPLPQPVEQPERK